jgi:hypothetical protein
MTSRKVQCSQCGREIKTVGMSAPLRRAPLVCKHCFGEESYRGPAHGLWSAHDAGIAALVRGSGGES